MSPSFRATWSAADLLAAHPPRLHHRNKQVVYAVASGQPFGGNVTVTRWLPMPLPDRLNRPSFESVPGYYTYGDSPAGRTSWHQNFADPNLFGYYGGPLLAQDEMQVAEHPVLASIPEAMKAAGAAARTEENGSPTPVLVKGAERRCVIDTGPDLAFGRTQGLYGNRFAQASEAVIRSATTALVPPTMSNILAIAALGGGRGPYTRAEIEHTLITAATGYHAAVLESDGAAEVHTGFWGCGAFGGDRVLMTTLQAVAAALAGVRRLVFHYGDSSGRFPVEDAKELLAELPLETDALVADLHGRGFVWGVGDGN